VKDIYPENIEIHINRDALRRYLRVKWLLIWMGGLSLFAFLFGMAVLTDVLDNSVGIGIQETIFRIVKGIVEIFLVVEGIATCLYFMFSHHLAARMSKGLRVSVEGAFLRIIQTGYIRVDRKLHFRSIVDYATVQGRLMRRFGIIALQMATTGGGNQSTIQIAGIQDCEKVRDMLAEIDSMRENG